MLRIFLLGLLADTSFAHPGHSVSEEAAERAEFLQFKPRSVKSCSLDFYKRGHQLEAVRRRTDFANRAIRQRGLEDYVLKRDFSEYNISHASTSGMRFGDDETLLFSDNSSCILQPEVTQGPYFVDGESIRSNVTDGQPGVPLYLDIQFIDTSSCEPVSAVYIDLWHANSTGVYSGVSAAGNGNSQNDTSNLDATFLRGIQQTDVNGVVQFETVFPGHYTGRLVYRQCDFIANIYQGNAYPYHESSDEQYHNKNEQHHSRHKWDSPCFSCRSAVLRSRSDQSCSRG